MNIYDPTNLYGISVKIIDQYTDLFRAIGVAIEACRHNDKFEQKNIALLALKQSCRSFSDTLTYTEILCDTNLTPNIEENEQR